MDAEVGRTLSPGARVWPGRIGHHASILTPTELARALPRKMARTLRAVLHAGSTPPGRDGIALTPMSGDWLQESLIHQARQGDAI